MKDSVASSKDNLVDVIKQKVNNFDKPSGWFMTLGIFLVIGFISGFLLKHLSRYVFWVIIGGAIALWILNLLNVVAIDYNALKSLMGGSDLSFSYISSWVNNHVAEFISLILGIFLAWELT